MLKKRAPVFVFVVVLMSFGSGAQAQIVGQWDVTFAFSDEPATVQFDIAQLLFFLFNGQTAPPENCSWIGIDVEATNNVSSIFGILNCDELGGHSNFFAFMFGSRTRRDMNGVALAPSVASLFVEFVGSRQH